MISHLIWLLNGAACLMVSWVAGCYLLRQGRPRSLYDVALCMALLGTCLYGVGVAITPIKWGLTPSIFALGWRVSLGAVAFLAYERIFGWRRLVDHINALPQAVRVWVMHHVAVGRAAGHAAQRNRRGR